MLHAKDPRREIMFTPQKINEYQILLEKTKGHKYASMVQDKPFLSLNPSEKSEIVAFICNELLSNKAVVHQIDNNVENISKAKKEKWETEAQVKRLKIIQAKKSRMGPVQHIHDESAEHLPPPVPHDDDKDDTLSVASENDTPKNNNKKGATKGNITTPNIYKIFIVGRGQMRGRG